MSEEKQLELPLNLEGTAKVNIDVTEGTVSTEPTSETEQTPKERELSKRDYEMAVRRAYKERDEKIKQNKKMLTEMQLEVEYWKAQSDLLKYRFEKMDYYMRNIELEPKYLAAIAEQQVKENSAPVEESKPLLS